MAEIKPFMAWRYNKKLSQNIEDLISPLFDVVSPEQLKELYENPFNSIHISVPKGSNSIQYARKAVEKWKSEKVIVQDSIPGIYVYYQYFRLPGMEKELCRKGFITLIRIYDWDRDEELLRHENTMPKAVNERKEILEKTDMQSSPTFGLYDDPGFELESIMDESIRHPVYETENYQGVKDVLSVIQDADMIKKFIRVLKDSYVILADGHHRYESAMSFQKQCMNKNPNHTGLEPYNYHMMYLSNFRSGDFRALPTHRLIKDLEDFDPEVILRALEKDFIIKTVANPWDLNEVIAGKKWAFGLMFKDKAYKIRLKPEAFSNFSWSIPDKLKELDISVLHHFVIEKVLGIPQQDQRTTENVVFDRNFADCLYKVVKEEVQMALIVNEISIEDILEVCKSGYIMPQKSTYFYPKVICGYTFYSLKDDETDPSFDPCFSIS